MSMKNRLEQLERIAQAGPPRAVNVIEIWEAREDGELHLIETRSMVLEDVPPSTVRIVETDGSNDPITKLVLH